MSAALFMCLALRTKCFWGVGGSNNSLKTFSTQSTNISDIQDSYLPSLSTMQMQTFKFIHDLKSLDLETPKKSNVILY